MVQPRGGKRQQRGGTGEDKQEGRDLPEFTVAGCGRTRRQVHREVTEEKSKMEEGEQQFESRPVSVSPRLLYRLVFFRSPFGLAASELLGTPGGGLLQGRARPKCGEIFRAAHVGSLKCTKSPFLLLSHPKIML